MKLTGLSWVALICAGVVPGCGPTTVRGTRLAAIDQSSPEALAVAFQDAIEKRNFAAMLECMEPDDQDLYDEYLVVCKRFAGKLDAAAAEIEKRIGRPEADHFRRKYGWTVAASPFRGAMKNGKVDWDQVKFSVIGQQATVTLKGANDRVLVANRIRGKWYITRDHDGGPPDDAHMPIFKRIVARHCRGVDLLRLKVVSGEISKDNFADYMYDGESVAGGPVQDGVKLTLLSAEKPTYRGGAALRFRLRAYNTLGEQGRRVCWRMPSCGLGENVVVELDGKPLALPQAKADAIGGWADGKPTDVKRWSITLPAKCAKTAGRHALRYTLVSRKGRHVNRNGASVPFLEGCLSSNEFIFIVRP